MERRSKAIGIIVLLIGVFCLFSCMSAGLRKKPKKVVLIAGKTDHQSGTHEHETIVSMLKECLDTSPNVKGIKTEVVFNGGWPKDPNILNDADTILICADGWERHPLGKPERMEKMRNLMNRGVGLVCIHFALAPMGKAKAEPEFQPDFLEWLGGYYQEGYSIHSIYTTESKPVANNHPITYGLKPWTTKNEYYYRIRFKQDDKRRVPILTSMLPPDKPTEQVIAWAVDRQDGGRGFGFTGGHFISNWNVESFRKMVLNAVLWTAKVEVPKEGVQSVVK